MCIKTSFGAGLGGASCAGWASILQGGVEIQTCVSRKELQGGLLEGFLVFSVAPCRDQLRESPFSAFCL